MARIFITGANGFVGAYAADAFAAAGYSVIRAGHGADTCDIEIDLRDGAAVEAAIARTQPTCVLHLAAQSFVPDALADPQATYEINIMGTARVVHAVRSAGRHVRLLYVSSAEIYGRSAQTHLPLAETAPPAPANPYAASKIAAEYIALAGASSDCEVIIARPFNHIGPGQDPRFVVAGFAAQIADIADGAEPVLSVGNLEAERDFLDVRDVVRAYVELMQTGVSGEVYNVASGSAVPIREILRRLLMAADIPVTIREDPQRMRPSEIPRFYGDSKKLRAATGWRPEISLDDSLGAILAAAHSREKAAAGAGVKPTG